MQFLATVSEVGTATPAVEAERLRRNGEILAACMQESGFDYQPVDWSYTFEDVPTPPPAREVSDEDREFAAQYGYGVSTQGELSAAAPASGYVDPNEAYVAAMSPAEQEAYYLALLGPGDSEEDVSADAPYDWTKHGCYGRAAHEQELEGEPFDDSPFEPLRAEIDALWPTIEADPRILAAEDAWSLCMDEAGYPGFDRAADAQASFFEEEMRILDEAFGPLQSDPSTADDQTSPEYLAAEQTAAELRGELVETEIATAVADLECQVEVGYRRVQAEVSAELQEEFYEEHRTDLEAWLTAIEEWEAAR